MWKYYVGSWKWKTIIAIILALILPLQFLSYVIIGRLGSEAEGKMLKYFQRHKNLTHIIENMKTSFKPIVLSSDGLYQIFTNVFLLSDHQSNYSKLTLITHCSVNHINKVLNILKIWDGPVIVTVYIPSPILYEGVWDILYLYHCHKHYMDRIIINVVTNFPCNFSIEEKDYARVSCSDQILKQRNGNSNYEDLYRDYPNNLLRNTGIRTAKTSYIFTIDIDMSPVKNAFKKLNEFLLQQEKSRTDSTSLTIFVVPVFEVRENINIPENKKDLIALWTEQNIRPFYSKVCEKCHSAMNYDLWKVLPAGSEVADVYTVDWIDPWEPFYVASVTIPLYSESFRSYGFNRISQACELHVAGYSFHVLNNVFVVHQGFKANHTFHATKDKQQKRNRLLFRRFKEDLKVKYPKSTNRCL